MIKKIKKPVIGFALTTSLTLLLSGCIIHVNAKDYADRIELSSSSYTSTNKKVSVPEGITTNNISSVNGKVSIDDNVIASDISNVNGKIQVGNNVQVDEISSVNGKISVGKDFKSNGNVTAVNGAISIGKNAEIGGSLKTVNGTIKAKDASIKQNIETKNGSVYVEGKTVVHGDVVFESVKNQNKSWSHRYPTLRISNESAVYGNIILKRKVNLEIQSKAMMEKVSHQYEE